MITLTVIVEERLRTDGMDGLYNEGAGCACVIGDLFPCEAPGADCTAGIKRPCECGDRDCGWHIVAST